MNKPPLKPEASDFSPGRSHDGVRIDDIVNICSRDNYNRFNEFYDKIDSYVRRLDEELQKKGKYGKLSTTLDVIYIDPWEKRILKWFEENISVPDEGLDAFTGTLADYEYTELARMYYDGELVLDDDFRQKMNGVMQSIDNGSWRKKNVADVTAQFKTRDKDAHE